MVLFLKDVLYGDTNLPERVIPHLLNVEGNYRALLHIVLCKNCNVFPGMLPTWAPPNHKVGDVHKIPLVEGAVPIKKSIYMHSP